MKKFTEKAQDYFDRHPTSDECHITSDGRVFHNIGAAQGMAGTLDDQNIESYSRKVLEKEKAESVTDTSIVDAAMMEAFLNVHDVDKMKYDDLKRLCKFFEIKTEDQKADTLIAALTEYKSTLNQQ